VLTIPKRFEEKLKQNTKLYSNILSTISIFEPIFENNILEFFPEYTYHGENHIQWVLDFENELIPQKSFEILKPNDIGVLILATIVHDLGMYISHDGLKTIMNSKNVIKGFDEHTWKDIWDDFFEEAKRYSDKKIKSIFGQVENIVIRVPPENTHEHTKIDKMLYGEFLRKYHHRLAHEIVMYGFPEADSSHKKFIEENDEFKEIVGVLGRSHGMYVRDTFDYLKTKYDDMYHRPNDICIFYLMSLLRIADYMHVGGDRAPHLLQSIRKIQSPISITEWDWNEAVNWRILGDKDPELLYINCNPQNSEIYIKIKNWLRDIQRELDTCWAILGETYGGIKNLMDFKLSIRRFESNIVKQKSQFAKMFVPEKVTFDFDYDLLKLLVAPLYGDNPSYGVRELIQNSVDACREREYLAKDKNYKPEVNIAINTDKNKEWYFVISDNGVGMTEKTLINYFLKAGASFRRNDDWLKKFTDENGRTKIQRTGKFGVGVLASFLLGKSIEVTTRNLKVLKNEGLYFKAEIDTEQIEVEKIDCKIGTTIKIKLDQDKYETLMNQSKNEYNNPHNDRIPWYCWYRSKSPIVKFNVPNTWNSYVVLDNPEENILPDEWHEISSDKFKEVKWTYKYPNYEESINTLNYNWKLCCNGIVIPRGYLIKGYSFPHFEETPRISVYDYDGKLGLNLDRNALSNEKIDFEKELVVDICKDIIAKLLVTTDILDKSGDISKTNFVHKSLNNGYWNEGSNNFIIFKNGYCLNNSYNIQKLNLKCITYVWMNEECNLNEKIFNFADGVVFNYARVSKSNFKYILENNNIDLDKEYEIKYKRFYIDEDMFRTITDSKKTYLTKGFIKNMKYDLKNEKYICIEIGNPSESKIDIKELNRNENIFLILERYLGDYKLKNGEIDVFSDIMSEYIGDDVIIPFSLNERKKKYPKAFRELEKYMNSYIDSKK